MSTTTAGSLDSASPIGTVALLRAACWFGAVSGFAQVAVMQGGIRLFHETVTLGPNMFWMTPLAMMLSLAGVGLLLVVARKVSPALRAQPMSRAVAPFAFLAFLNLELFIPHVHLVVDFLIAAGLASVTLRIINRHETSFRRLVRKTVAPLLALVLLLAIGILIGGWVRERRALRRLAAAHAGMPNVLLLVFDTARSKSLSLYGYPRPTTPQLIRWAQRGVVFQHAVSPAPWTLPSHASMFTGHWPHELSADWETPLGPTPTTLAEFFDSKGYATGGFVANLSYASRVHGLSRGFIHYDDFPLSVAELFVSGKLPRDFLNHPWLRRITGFHDVFARKNAHQVGSRFLRWTAQQKGRPFFAFLNFFDAHEPYMPPAEFDRRFASSVPRKTSSIRHQLHQGTLEWHTGMTPAELDRERDAYEAAIAFMDSTVGGILDEMKQLGLLDNTVIVITADHGEHFGEHGKYSHGNSLFRPLLEVPLLVIFPSRVPSGRTVGAAVSLRDIPRTVLDLAGLADSSAPFPGHSLLPLIGGERDSVPVSPAISELTLAGGSRAVSLYQDSLHLIYWKGKDMLFNWRTDPDEAHDLAADSTRQVAIQRMRRLLDSAGSIPASPASVAPQPGRAVSVLPESPHGR